VIYVLDNREGIVGGIGQLILEVRMFFIKKMRKILKNPNLEEIISAHIHPFLQNERLPVVLDKMRCIVK